MVEEREGEDVGPVDWAHEMFNAVRDGVSIPDLRELEVNPERWEATTDRGWPRVGWGRVLAFRMYDGWPYWRPHPALLTTGPLGPEWHSVRSVTDLRRIREHAVKEDE